MSEKHFTTDEIESILKNYYDLPGMISAEFQSARQFTQTLAKNPSPAIRNYAENGIRASMARAGELATQHRFIHNALYQMDPRERQILKYRLMGPSDPERRKKGYRLPPWKAIGPIINMCKSQALQIKRETILRLAGLPVELVTFESSVPPASCGERGLKT